MSIVFVSQIGGAQISGMTVDKSFAKLEDDVRAGGIFIAAKAEGGQTVAHEFGHALAGKTEPYHSENPADVMHHKGSGTLTSEPWKCRTCSRPAT